MSDTKPKVLTVGTGAIGAIYSWRLANTCHVTTVCRSNYDVVKQSGFKIDSSKFGQGVFQPFHVVRSVEEAVKASDSAFDYILVTLKALPEVYDIGKMIAPAVSANTTIVLIQNGLGVEEPFVERFPKNPIVSIVAYIGTSQVKPGEIFMNGAESLVIGRYLPSPVDATAQRDAVVSLFEQGGVDVVSVDDVERLRWQKLFWNASFSSVCTITGLNTSEILADETATHCVKSVMRDVITAANAMGYDFDVEEQIENMMSRTTATAKDYKPSMQLDRERGNPMEIHVILGVPMQRAKDKGVQVPYLELIHGLCMAINSKLLAPRSSNESQL